MKLTYTVAAADETPVTRELIIDGQAVSAIIPGLSVQLTSPQGSIFLNLSGPQAEGHPFTVGEDVAVTFGEV